jgi:uncharacterized protein
MKIVQHASRRGRKPLRVGLISDTHDLVRAEALAFLAGSDTAVRGNNDRGAWADALRESELVQVADAWLYAIHDRARIDLDPAAADVRVVVFGHSHKPLVDDRDGVLWVNPGSAGPRRFRLPISVGELLVDGSHVSARTVEL